MNIELPSPAETEHIRTILLIVLGVMIVTIPMVALIVIAKVQAQRKRMGKGDPPSVPPGAGAPEPRGDD